MRADALLRLEDIAYRYPGASHPSLNGVSFAIERGRIFGLLGPNGAGKTTLISLIAGLLRPQQGNMVFDTGPGGPQPLAHARRAMPTGIALVPQDNAVYPMLTVLENLRFFAGVQGLHGAVRAQRIDMALAFGQLERVARQSAAQLSGGLRRRLNLAIGLLGDPQLLLLDEPTVGVDPQSRHFLLDSIASLRSAGKTIVYTSHYMDEVQALCDHVAIVDHGRVLVQGTLAELTQAPARQGTQALVFRLRSPLPAALQTRLEQGIALRQTGGSNDASYSAMLDPTELPALLLDLQSQGCTLHSLSLSARNLEQVFMDLTKRSLRD